MNTFAKACVLSNEEWVDSLPTEVKPYQYSKQHKRKMKKLFSKMRNDKYHKYTKNTVRILTVAAIMSSMTITAFAVPQSREYIIKKLFNYSSYTINDTDNAEIVSNLSVGYIPDGFELTNEFKSNNAYLMEYSKGDSFIVVNKYTLDNKINFDTGIYDYEIYVINNIEYTIYHTQSNTYGIVWNNGSYLYNVDSNMSKDEIMQIAISIE